MNEFFAVQCFLIYKSVQKIKINDMMFGIELRECVVGTKFIRFFQIEFEIKYSGIIDLT